MNKDCLICIYDLNVAPATYDVIKFIVAARMTAQLEGRNSLIYLLIYPSLNSPKRYSHSDFLKRVQHLIVASMQVLGDADEVLTFTDRSDADQWLRKIPQSVRFPKDYSIAQPKSFYELGSLLKLYQYQQGIHRFEKRRDHSLTVARILKEASERTIVVITLRYCNYQTDRNANIRTWYEFVKTLNENEYFVIVLDDGMWNDWGKTASNCLVLENQISIRDRFDLYLSAKYNLLVNTGPLALCHLSKANFLAFKMIVKDSPSASLSFFRRHGFPLFAQYPWCGDQQRIIWEEDDLEVVLIAFKAACLKPRSRLSYFNSLIENCDDTDIPEILARKHSLLKIALSYCNEKIEWLYTFLETSLRSGNLDECDMICDRIIQIQQGSQKYLLLETFLNRIISEIAYDPDLCKEVIDLKVRYLELNDDYIKKFSKVAAWGCSTRCKTLFERLTADCHSWSIYDIATLSPELDDKTVFPEWVAQSGLNPRHPSDLESDIDILIITAGEYEPIIQELIKNNFPMEKVIYIKRDGSNLPSAKRQS